MTADSLLQLEAYRLELQSQLDAAKSKKERNQLGQFATPAPLANAILQQAKRFLSPEQPIRFLDPAIGTGAFFSALLSEFSTQRIKAARGYEVDPHYGEPSRFLWRDRCAEIVIGDFTQADAPVKEVDKFNLLICNPPYVRHHYLKPDDKKRLQMRATQGFHAKPNGLSGLYIYFVGIAHAWLQEGGIAGWLIPSEFMDVNYGSVMRHYFTSRVTLLEIHRFDPLKVQFDDALVSSALVWLRKESPRPKHEVRFSVGGNLDHPKISQEIALTELRRETKWTRFPIHAVRHSNSNGAVIRLKEFFDVKRGIATGANEFFILDKEQIRQHELPIEFLTPILPSPRYLEVDEVRADSHGNPLIKKPLYLLDCDLPEEQVEQQYPTLWRYLQIGITSGIHKGYLCRHRSRWYVQDRREPSLFLCTYMGRSSTDHIANPFRFILNHSRAVAPNVYLNIYPKRHLAEAIVGKPELKAIIWKSFQTIPVNILLSGGRVYGGGLYKLEPKELSNLPITDVFDWQNEMMSVAPRQTPLF